MQRKRHGNILIFLDAAIIMRVQISEPSLLIERILLHIQTGRVDMCAQDVHPVFHRFLSDMKEDNGLVHPYAVNFVSLLHLFLFFQQRGQFYKSFLLRHIHQLVYTLALRLSLIQKLLVSFCKGKCLLLLLLMIGCPGIFTNHLTLLDSPMGLSKIPSHCHFPYENALVSTSQFDFHSL